VSTRSRGRRADAPIGADGAELWRRVESSPMAHLYVEEAYWLARGIAQGCDEIFEATPAPTEPPPANYIKVDGELHLKMVRVLSEAAKLRALIASRPKSKEQALSEHAFQEARAQWLRTFLGGVSLDAVSNARARNSVEHFDEYLDEIARQTARRLINRPTAVLFNMTLGRPNALDVGSGSVVELRVFLASDRVFVNAGYRVDFQALRDLATAVAERLGSLIGSRSHDERGAFITLLTPEGPP
jgi:hypothetical protein